MHSLGTIIKQTDEELIFCIETLPLGKQWRNIIFLENNGLYAVAIEKYYFSEGRSHYKTVGRFSSFENAEDVFKKERFALIVSLLDEKVIEIDDCGNIVPPKTTSSELMISKR